MSNPQLWEVFLCETNGGSHQHIGSVMAADPKMALQNARDVFLRRGSFQSLWVVKSNEIYSIDRIDNDYYFNNSIGKDYREAESYKLAMQVKGL